MKLATSKVNALRQTLKDAGLYNERNEPLIKRAVELEMLVERYGDDLRHQSLLISHQTSTGSTTKKINPLAVPYAKAQAAHARVLAYLGLGNKTLEVKADKEERSLLDKLMQGNQ